MPHRTLNESAIQFHPKPIQQVRHGDASFFTFPFLHSNNWNTNTVYVSPSIEHFLDLVNADFSDDVQVDRILDTWEELRPDANNSSHHRVKGFVTDGDGDGDGDEQDGVTENKRAPIWKEIPIMFRRHILLIVRDRKYY